MRSKQIWLCSELKEGSTPTYHNKYCAYLWNADNFGAMNFKHGTRLATRVGYARTRLHRRHNPHENLISKTVCISILCLQLLSIGNLQGLVGISNFHRHNNEVG